MPMGVTNGNAAFQRMLENLIDPLHDCADPFVDDVIIASGDPSMSYDELLMSCWRSMRGTSPEFWTCWFGTCSQAAVTRPPLR